MFVNRSKRLVGFLVFVLIPSQKLRCGYVWLAHLDLLLGCRLPFTAHGFEQHRASWPRNALSRSEGVSAATSRWAFETPPRLVHQITLPTRCTISSWLG